MSGTKPRQDSNHGAKRPYQRHGLTPTTLALRAWGDRALEDALDGRTRGAQELAAWRSALVEDLGGEHEITAQQRTLVELAVRQRFILNGIDSWLFERMEKFGPSFVVNKRSRCLFPIVTQREKCASALASLMAQLGLERREAKPIDLADYVVETYGQDDG